MSWNPSEVRLQVARDLREVLRLYAGLRIEAVNRAGDPDMPGGAAMVMLGPGADVEAFGYMQLSAIFGRIDESAVEEVLKSDLEPPLSFLASWSDLVREARGQEASGTRATITGEVRYLAGAVDWMLSTNDEGEAWFLPVEDFANGLNRVRSALETVLRDGDRPTRINAECRRCTASPRLCVRYGVAEDGSDDGWFCPDCGKDYDLDGIRKCWRQMLVRRGEAPKWLHLRKAALAIDRPVSTVRTWTLPPRDTDGNYRTDKAARVDSYVGEDGRTWVDYAEVRAIEDATRRRKSVRTVA